LTRSNLQSLACEHEALKLRVKSLQARQIFKASTSKLSLDEVCAPLFEQIPDAKNAYESSKTFSYTNITTSCIELTLK
jgi:hypothetical protein